jgi:hypothetical protein
MTTDAELLPMQPISLPPVSIVTTSLLAKAEWGYMFIVQEKVMMTDETQREGI